jgi:hypothetical protein
MQKDGIASLAAHDAKIAQMLSELEALAADRAKSRGWPGRGQGAGIVSRRAEQLVRIKRLLQEEREIVVELRSFEAPLPEPAPGPTTPQMPEPERNAEERGQ